MPKPARGPRLGTGPSHQKLLLSGLAAALFRDERIRTTEARAKRLRPVAERLITLGKSGTVHARRQALRMIEDRDVVHKLFAEIGPRYQGRDGGYTRILKLGPRLGDAAMMAIVELTEGEAEVATGLAGADQEPKRRRGVLGRRRPKAAAQTAETGEELEAPEAPTEGEESEEAPEALAEASETQADAAEVDSAGDSEGPNEGSDEALEPKPE